MKVYDKDVFGNVQFPEPAPLDKPVDPGPFENCWYCGEDMIIPRGHRYFKQELKLAEVCQVVRQQEAAADKGPLSRWRVNHFRVRAFWGVQVRYNLYRRQWEVLTIAWEYAQLC